MQIVVLVTGANRGLGKEAARQLASRGMTVVVGSRTPSLGVDAAAELAVAGGSVRAVQLDVTEATSVHAAADEIERIYGRLDVLVNNAGISGAAPVAAIDGALWHSVLDVNLVGAANAIQAFVPLLRRSHAPRIVNVSSRIGSLTLSATGSEFGGGDASLRLAYATSKAALNMLTIQYARSFSRDPSLRHIKINAAAPGYVATDMNEYRGTRTVQEGARVIVQLATLPADGPTGGFFNDEGPLPW